MKLLKEVITKYLSASHKPFSLTKNINISLKADFYFLWQSLYQQPSFNLVHSERFSSAALAIHSEKQVESNGFVLFKKDSKELEVNTRGQELASSSNFWTRFIFSQDSDLVELLNPSSIDLNKLDNKQVYISFHSQLNQEIIQSVIDGLQCARIIKRKLYFDVEELDDLIVKDRKWIVDYIDLLLNHNNHLFALNIYSYLLKTMANNEEFLQSVYSLIVSDSGFKVYLKNQDNLTANLISSWHLTEKLMNQDLASKNFLFEVLMCDFSEGVLRLMDIMDEKRASSLVSTSIFNKILTELMATQERKAVFSLVNFGKKHRIYFDLKTYNILINLAVETYNWNLLHVQFNALLESKLQPDSVTCNTLLKSLLKNSDPLHLSFVVEKLKQYKFQPNELTSSIALPLRRATSSIKLLSFLNGYVIPKFDSTLPSVQFSLESDSIRKMRIDSEDFQDILKKMKKSPNDFSRRLYGSILYKLTFAGELEDAETVYKYMLVAWKAPSLPIVTNLIQVYILNNNYTKAFGMIDQLTSFGLSPSPVMMQQVIIGLQRTQDPKYATELFNSFIKLGFKPTVELLNSRLNNLICLGKFKEAFSFFETYKRKGLAKDTFTYNLLIKAAFMQGNNSRAFRLWDIMKKEHIPSDQETYLQLLKGTANAHNHEVPRGIYKSLARTGFTYDQRLSSYINRRRNLLCGSKP